MPYVTIITICYRNPEDLRHTLSSLAPLRDDLFERLVIDGSPDRSCEEVSLDFPGVRHLRQQDTGKYDAMNKGIAEARGDTLLFMNSGDSLFNADRLELELTKHLDYISNNLLYADTIFDIGGVSIYVPAPELSTERVKKGVLPSHQAILIPTNFHRLHPYDDTMDFAADTKFLKVAFAALPAKHLEFVLARFAYGGVSTSPGSWRSIAQQLRELRKAHELSPRETITEAIRLIRRKILQAAFGEAWFRRVQRERLIASGRAYVIKDEPRLNPPYHHAI